MKAMQLKETKEAQKSPLEMVDLEEPTPGPDQVKIDVKACGVCHTDLHIVEGDLEIPGLPIVPGHEVVGRVEGRGIDVNGFEVGDRVGVPWVHSSCGGCRFCRRGKENLCEDLKFTGLDVNGGYAEKMVSEKGFTFHLPESFSDENAAPLLCAGIIGYRSFRLSEVEPGENLGLFGFGSSAHLVIQLATGLGCDVYVFTRSEEHRKLARKLGSVWEGSAKDDPPKKIDSAITFAPAGWVAREALRVLDKDGTLAINAIHMTPIPELDYDLLYGERKIRSVTNVTRRDAHEFLKIAGGIPIETEVETFSLKDVNEALQRLKKSEINGAGVLRI